MEKLKSFRITALHMEGFKSYSQPTDLTFGDPTVITGGNGRGKSSIADAIAFAVTGLPFFGERRIDRLHSEDNPDLFIRMRFVDENGTLHELSRVRKSNRMTITYDGCEVRQVDLTDLFGERDVFLSMEVSELMKRLTGRNYPQFVDNMESVDDLANVRPTGQIIMAKCVSKADLSVRPVKPILTSMPTAA